jgi:excisionase family DNA binding protein
MEIKYATPDNPLEYRFLRPRDVARLARISPSRVYRAIHDGTLPAIRFGEKTILIRPESAYAWIEEYSEPVVSVAE